LIIWAIGIVALLLSIFFGIVVFVALFSAIATSHAKRGHDCGSTKSIATEITVATSPADQTIDSFIKEHEEAYILSWKAGGYLPSFSIAQTFVEYGFNFTNPSGTSFWLAHNMGGVKTGGDITNFPITLETYGIDAVDLSGTRLGTNVGDNTGGNYAWFKSYDAGIVAKSEFMAHQTLYKGAINNTEPRAISKAIAQGGWASDPVAYENSLNNAYDSVGANYKWLDEKAIKKYGKSPFVEIGPIQPSDSLGATAKPKTRNKCGKRSHSTDGTGRVPSGVQVDGSGWTPQSLPAELKEYIIDPQTLGLEYNNPTGWVEHSGECVDLTVSLGNILWGHSGTVIGDGKLKINLARLDTRLLHGQVATAWTPDSKADRIIVASDNVANDELRKELIKQAAPNGVKANVVPIQKLIDVAKDPRFGETHALILFETPQDALRAIEGGVPIKTLNVGSMAHSTGKTMINNVLSMDKEDVATFEKMRDLGVEFDVRKVPNDTKKDLFDLINKANVQ